MTFRNQSPQVREHFSVLDSQSLNWLPQLALWLLWVAASDKSSSECEVLSSLKAGGNIGHPISAIVYGSVSSNLGNLRSLSCYSAASQHIPASMQSGSQRLSMGNIYSVAVNLFLQWQNNPAKNTPPFFFSPHNADLLSETVLNITEKRGLMDHFPRTFHRNVFKSQKTKKCINHLKYWERHYQHWKIPVSSK